MSGLSREYESGTPFAAALATAAATALWWPSVDDAVGVEVRPLRADLAKTTSSTRWPDSRNLRALCTFLVKSLSAHCEDICTTLTFRLGSNENASALGSEVALLAGFALRSRAARCCWMNSAYFASTQIGGDERGRKRIRFSPASRARPSASARSKSPTSLPSRKTLTRGSRISASAGNCINVSRADSAALPLILSC